MTSLASRRRRNTLLALTAGLISAVLVLVLLVVGVKAITNSKAGRNAAPDVTVTPFPQTPTAMLATIDDTNKLTSIAVFVLAPDADATAAGYDQRGGSIVSVPINADTESGDQLTSLQDAYASGGEEELRADLESAINLTIDFSAVMTHDQLTKFLAPLPSITVDLPRDVLGADDSVLFPKGTTELNPDQAAQILTTRSPTERERLRRTNIEALWVGITKEIGQGVHGQQLSAATPTTFAELATRLMAGSTASRGLLARAIDSARNPDRLDIESLDRPDAILVFASIAPASMTRPGSGLSYRLEAPPGYDAQVRKTIATLLADQGNVVSVDLSAKPSPQTTFLIYDPQMAAAEPTDNHLFGTIKVETPAVRLQDIDVSIVLGTTYLDGVNLSAPDATSTTATVPGTTG
jgi:hypothetical protein